MKFAVPSVKANEIDNSDEEMGPSNETYNERLADADAGDINFEPTIEWHNAAVGEDEDNEEAEATSVGISDARKYSAGALESHFCFVEVMQVRNLWNAWTVGLPNQLWQEILDDQRAGLERAMCAAINSLAQTFYVTLRSVSCSVDLWVREFTYANVARESLASLCSDDGSRMRSFLHALFATEGAEIDKRDV